MTLYRVEVTVTGVMRVECDSPEEAEKTVRAAEPTLQGKKLFGPKIVAKAVGTVDNQKFSPDGLVSPART